MLDFVPSGDRVAYNTPAQINREIENRTDDSVFYYAAHPEYIDQRLLELDEEWDIERYLEANASTLMLIGTTLGAAVDRRWLWLPGTVAAFLLQHAVQGWCPPVSVFRRRGVRTKDEIFRERYALRALRGDFGGLEDLPADPPARATAVLMVLGE